MRKRIIITVSILGILILTGIRLISNKKTTEERVYRYNKNQVISIQADTAKLQQILTIKAYPGTFEPNKESKLSTDIQGKITQFYVDLGSSVKKGESLVQLDNSLLNIQLQTINVQIKSLEADVNRYTVLSKAEAIQGVQLEKAELGLQSALLQKATIQEQIAKTTLRAPFDGIVTAKFSEAGAFAAPGIPLLQLSNISELKFTIAVPENDLCKFQMHQDGIIRADVYNALELPCIVSMIGSKALAGNNYQVQFTTQNTQDLKIKAGMFGKVIPVQTEPELKILIPASAIMGSDENAHIYLIQNQQAKLQPVTLGERFENNVSITHGLQSGDIYVTSGFINLFNGANVTFK